MMKKNSKLLIASVSAMMLMTATASARDNRRITAMDVGGLAIGLMINSINQDSNKAPAGHKNLGPVSKQRNQELLRNKGRAPAKQAPRTKNTAPTAVAKSAPKAAAPVAVARVADPNVLEAQKNLAALGFHEVGKPDGFAGKGTASAVKAFEEANGLPETGVLSATVIALIAKDAMIAKNQPTEAITEVAEIAPEEEFEPENFIANEVTPDPIPVAEKVTVPEVEKAPEKAPEPVATAVATAVASVATTPETKTQEVKAVETPVASENEW